MQVFKNWRCNLEPISCWKQGMGTDRHNGQGDGVVDSRTQGQVLRLCPKAGIIQTCLAKIALSWLKTNSARKMTTVYPNSTCAHGDPLLLACQNEEMVTRRMWNMDKAMKMTTRARKRQLHHFPTTVRPALLHQTMWQHLYPHFQVEPGPLWVGSSRSHTLCLMADVVLAQMTPPKVI